ncbi:hypothetical protein R6G71_08720, partial [Actinobaculum suis]
MSVGTVTTLRADGNRLPGAGDPRVTEATAGEITETATSGAMAPVKRIVVGAILAIGDQTA